MADELSNQIYIPPQGWTVGRDVPTNRLEFYNPTTGQRQMEPPEGTIDVREIILPRPWKQEYSTSKNCPFFGNPTTGEKIYTLPPGTTLRNWDVYGHGDLDYSQFARANTAKFEAAPANQEAYMPGTRDPSVLLPDGWEIKRQPIQKRPTDPYEPMNYFYNEETGRTLLDLPPGTVEVNPSRVNPDVRRAHVSVLRRQVRRPRSTQKRFEIREEGEFMEIPKENIQYEAPATLNRYPKPALNNRRDPSGNALHILNWMRPTNSTRMSPRLSPDSPTTRKRRSDKYTEKESVEPPEPMDTRVFRKRASTYRNELRSRLQQHDSPRHPGTRRYTDFARSFYLEDVLTKELVGQLLAKVESIMEPPTEQAARPFRSLKARLQNLIDLLPTEENLHNINYLRDPALRAEGIRNIERAFERVTIKKKQVEAMILAPTANSRVKQKQFVEKIEDRLSIDAATKTAIMNLGEDGVGSAHWN